MDGNKTSEERSPSVSKLIMTHDEFVCHIKCLADKISQWMEHNYQFAALVPIPRGGMVPAVYLSHLLNIKVIQDPIFLLKNEATLFIEDIVDTGETMERFNNNKIFGRTEIDKIASLAIKPWASQLPDFHAFETKDWIVFPWELGDIDGN